MTQCDRDPNMTYHLDELLRIGVSSGGKNQAERGGADGSQA
jgi:hypothetical protein